MAGNPRQDLYLEISNNLEERELTNLRNYVSGANTLPAGFVEKANAHQIFNQLEKEGKSKHGDLTLLANILRKIGRDDYAEKVDNVAENEWKSGNDTQQPDQIQRKKRRADDAGDTFGGGKRQAGEPPILHIVIQILAQVRSNVENAEEMAKYAEAKEKLYTIDITADDTNEMLQRIKSTIKTIPDLLNLVKAIETLERVEGIKVVHTKTGSIIFHLQCTDINGLGELWFMYKSGKLNDLLVGSLVGPETLPQLCAESIRVETTINREDFRKALEFLLKKAALQERSKSRLPQEYPLYQPPTRATINVLDELHLERTKKLPNVSGEQHFQNMSLRDDSEKDLLSTFDSMQLTDDQQATEALDDNPEVPQMTSEMVSLDIEELEQLMRSRRKRSSSIGSESSGYITGTPGSGPSRPDSPTGEGDTQNTLENLLAALNTPAVMEDKAQQFDLYCQIGDLYRTKLHNLQSALQYYQYMLKGAQELPEDIRLVVAYSRLGLTCDILGLQEEASHNHEMALRAINRLVSSKPKRKTTCVAYKNLASSLALSGHVSDAKANYERAMDVAMETGNKTEQMEIFCMLGDLHREQLHEPQVSHQYYMKMLALARQFGRKKEECIAYNRLGQVHYEMGEYEAALEWGNKHLEMSAEDGDKKEQTAAHLNVGNIHWFLGKLDQATSHLKTALQMAQQTGDLHAQMKAYHLTGDMHKKQLHSPHTAIQYYEHYLDLARQLKDRHEEGMAYNRLGVTHHDMGEYEAALKWYLKDLKIVQQVGDKKGQTAAHICAGNTYRFLGKLDQATSHFNTALQMAQQTGDQHAQMDVYCKMGDMHMDQLHSPHTAIQYYEHALDLARLLKDKHQEGIAYNRLGVTHNDMGEFEVALEWNLKHMKIVQQIGDKKGQTTALTCLGNTYRFLGKLGQAKSHFNTALQMAQQTGDQHAQMKAYFKMGEMHREQLHSPGTAIQYYEHALDLARQLQDKHEEGIAYNSLGVTHSDMEEYEVALKWNLKYLKIVQQVGDKKGQTAAHICLGDAYRFLGKLDQATSHFNTALQMAQQTGDQHAQMGVYCNMGEMHTEQLHSPRTAIQYYEKALDLARQLNDRNQEGVLYHRLGVAHFDIEENEAGLQWFQKALQIQANEDSNEQGTTHPSTYPKRMQERKFMMILQMKICFQMGETQRDQLHSPRAAIQYYEHALAVARQLGDRHEEGLSYDRLGRVHFELKKYEKALDLYQKYLTMKEDDGDKQAQITAHKNIAKSYKKLGEKDLARSYYQSAIKIAMETGNKQQQDDIRKKIAKL